MPRRTPVRGTRLTPHKPLEHDQMENLGMFQNLIKGEEVAGDELSRWSGLDEEREEKCVPRREGPW